MNKNSSRTHCGWELHNTAPFLRSAGTCVFMHKTLCCILEYSRTYFLQEIVYVSKNNKKSLTFSSTCQFRCCPWQLHPYIFREYKLRRKNNKT